MFTGRHNELQILEKDHQEKKSSIVTIYGRRRIGKSQLVLHFTKGKPCLCIEALERQHTPQQIKHFKNQMASQLNDTLLKSADLRSWEQVFDYLTAVLEKQKSKMIWFFDEFQWMAAGQSKLVSLIKFYWDTKWKSHPLQLILCGSISSYMVGKVIRSKALFGRIDVEIKLEDMLPYEAKSLLGVSEDETLKYLLLFGGVPKYLELIQRRLSFDKNVDQLCFQKNSYFLDEFDKIFYSQFKRHRLHEKIVMILSKGNRTLTEITDELKLSSGGGITRYLKELELAGFIMFIQTVSYGKKEKHYRLIDEYLRFYFQYIRSNVKLIKTNASRFFFRNRVLPKWNPWLGLSFENFCLKRIDLICRILEIEDTLVNFGPIVIVGKGRKDGVQVDLALETSDRSIFVCECKYHDATIGLDVIDEMKSKLVKIKFPSRMTVKKVLISLHGASNELKQAQFFDAMITAQDLLRIK